MSRTSFAADAEHCFTDWLDGQQELVAARRALYRRVYGGEMEIKNEHIVYAFAPLLSGGNLLLVGVTDIGWQYLGEEMGNFLKVETGSQFRNVENVWIVRAKNKAEIHTMIQTIARQMGVTLTVPS